MVIRGSSRSEKSGPGTTPLSQKGKTPQRWVIPECRHRGYTELKPFRSGSHHLVIRK